MKRLRWSTLVAILAVLVGLGPMTQWSHGGNRVALASPDCVTGAGGLAAYYFDGSKGTLNLSNGQPWVITLTDIDGSAVTGNKVYHLLIQDHGTGSGWETLATQVHHDFYGAGGHLVQSDDQGWTVRSSHGFNPNDVPGKFDLRVVISQRSDDKWDVSPYFRLPGGDWTLFYDGSWVTAAAFDLTKTRVAVGIDAGGGGTLCFNAPTANGVDLANVFVDDDWVGLPDGEEVLFPGDPNPHYIGLDAFAVIQDGIDNVAGSTVNVADGIYTATSLASIVIAKDGLSLVGESRDGTIIDGGTWGTSSAGWPKGIHVYANDVTIRNLTVRGFTGDTVNTGGYGIVFRDWAHDTPGEGYIFYSGGLVENVKLEDNYSSMYALVHRNLTVRDSLIQDSLADGMFIARESDNATVTGNTVLNSGNHGIWVGYCWSGLGPSDNATITKNLVDGAIEGGISFVASNGAVISGNDVSHVKGEEPEGDFGGWSRGAISLKDGVSNVTVSNNVVHDNDGLGTGSGRGIGVDGTSSNITLTGNIIRDNAGGGIKVMGTTSGWVASYNSIHGNTSYGAQNTTGSLLGFTGNWWGSDSGPTHALNPGGTGDAVSDKVAYSPWLGIGDDFSVDTGFQPWSPMTFIVEPQVCLPVGCIQQGVNLASNGDTIQVKAGTYNEQVVIDTPNLTLNGPNASVDPGCSGTRPTAEATIAWSTLTTVGTASTVVIAANGVTVDGFTIQNTNGTQNQVSVLIGGHYVGDTHPSDGSNVRNNIISSGYNNVYVWQSSDSTIARNRVTASVETQISIRDSATQGSRDALRNSVLNNCIDKAGVTSLGHSVAIGVTPVGSAAQDFTGTLIQGNTMKNSSAGTGLYRGIDAYFANGTTAEPVRIYGNTITDTSEQAIRIESSNNYDIGGSSSSTGNTITGSRGAVGGYRRGIATAGTSTGLSIQYNTISGHSSTSGNDGEIVVTTSGNTILHNTLYVADSLPTGVGGIGLRLDTPSNVFGENTFQGDGQRMLQASGAPGPGLTVVDVTASTFKTATGTTLDPHSLVDLVSIEDRVRHHMDVPSNLVLLIFKTDTTVATALNNASTPGAVQRAINAVPGSSSTVVVGPGTYDENVSINKPLILQATSKPVIDGGAAGDAISVSADGVTIDGFEIRNGYNGISLASASNTVISDNEIHHNVNVPGSAGVGILFWGNNDNNQILNNVIHDNDRQGFFIGDCDFAGPDWACTVAGTAISTGNTISGNKIYNNGLNETGPPDASRYGIQLWNADNNTIEKNEVYGHTKTAGWWFAVGIYLCGATNTAVQTNVLHDNEYNIGINDCGGSSAGTSITGNSIIGAGNTGIRVWSNASTTVARFNIISGNASYGVRNTDTTGDVDARGNWWGDVTGPYHPTKNPGGLGDDVSDYVLFDAVPDNCPTVYNPDQLNSDSGRRPNGSQISGEWASNPAQDKLGDACDPDNDNDALPDASENDLVCPYRLTGDSDGDRMLDGFEAANGSNACGAASKPTCTDTADSDGDGLMNCLEHFGYNTCASTGDTVPGWSTCANPVDSDSDGCADVLEVMDINGDRKVAVGDQTLLAKRAVGIIPPSDSDPIFDVNKDGKISIGDQTLMAKNTCNLKPWLLGCSTDVCPAE